VRAGAGGLVGAGQVAFREREADQRFAYFVQLLKRCPGLPLFHLGRQRHQHAAENQHDDEKRDPHLDQREAAHEVGMPAHGSLPAATMRLNSVYFDSQTTMSSNSLVEVPPPYSGRLTTS